MAEADPILKHVHTMQGVYFQRYDYYAADLADLAAVGWATPTGLKYFGPPAITAGGGPGSTTYTVCMTGIALFRTTDRSINQDGVLGPC